MKNENCWYKEVCTQECAASCIRYNEMRYLLDSSGIPKNKQLPISLSAGNDYDAFCKLADIKNNISNFVEQGYNVYICGKDTGNGKTSWAIKLMLKYFDTIWAGNGFRVRGLFIHVPTFLSKLKDFENPILKSDKDLLGTTDLIIWDDLAAGKVSAYDETNLLVYIDNRLISGKSNIFTTNIVNLKGLESCLGSRIASRIWHSSEIIEFCGKDRRG